jgi:hypothetical protein
MNSTVDMPFIKLMVEKRNFYYISLSNVLGWFNEKYTFREYITNGECKREFDNKYLYGDEILHEAGSNDDFEADYELRTFYNVALPFFSSSGFKSLCNLFGTPRTHYIKNVFNLVEHTYLHVVSDDNDEYTSLDDSSILIDKIKNLFIKTMINCNNRPLR